MNYVPAYMARQSEKNSDVNASCLFQFCILKELKIIVTWFALILPNCSAPDGTESAVPTGHL